MSAFSFVKSTRKNEFHSMWLRPYKKRQVLRTSKQKMSSFAAVFLYSSPPILGGRILSTSKPCRTNPPNAMRTKPVVPLIRCNSRVTRRDYSQLATNSPFRGYKPKSRSPIVRTPPTLMTSPQRKASQFFLRWLTRQHHLLRPNGPPLPCSAAIKLNAVVPFETKSAKTFEINHDSTRLLILEPHSQPYAFETPG